MDDRVIKAMGEPNRLRLMKLMSERSYCVKALSHASGLSESSVSQHLKLLREAGLVVGVMRRKPCDGPFYGCTEAEYIRCQAYVPPEKR